MARNDLKLLDCTLRDGGYVNEWKWGFQTARDVINLLVKARIDIVEVGFLRDVAAYDPDVSVCNYIEDLNNLIPANAGHTMFSAMAMRSNYDVNKLSPYNGHGIEMIRVTAHDYDIEDGIDFAREVKRKGYKLSVNPINIMGYSDERILWIINKVNQIQPYQFSIVDTFGSMKRRDLDRIVSLVDNNLDRNIRVALHLHENMSLSFFLAQNFVDKHLNRPVSIDGSLMGMGRVPGNLPIELIADYLNEYGDKSYDIDYLMDAIQDYIDPIKGASKWGYTPAYFLSARFNLHRNYAEHFLGKGDLTNRDINHILARIEDSKKNVFDIKYADKLYETYKDNRVNDTLSRKKLSNELKEHSILLVAPGETLTIYKDKVNGFIDKEKPVVISVNFIPDNICVDYAFFSNNKRYDKLNDIKCKTIVTSNISDVNADFTIDYNSLTGSFSDGLNSYIMLLKLLKGLGVDNIYSAGADGYVKDRSNYYSASIHGYAEKGNQFNMAVIKAIKKLDVNVTFITPSEYDVID